MEVTRLPIDGAFEIVPRVFADERGYFKETYAASRYLAAGIDQPFVQDNLSLSQRFVLRGLHSDPRMAKIVQVLTGAAYDVIVDVRRESPSFMRWHAVTLRAPRAHAALYPGGLPARFPRARRRNTLFYKQSC